MKANLPASFLVLLLISHLLTISTNGSAQTTRFHVLVLAENGGHHIAFTKVATPWLNKLATDSNFTISYISNPSTINDSSLKQYQLFIQLDYPPYGWPQESAAALQRYIEEGRGGWVGFHHATLIGEFDGFPKWNWFSGFMGDITYKNYIASFVSANIHIEDPIHPCMKGLPLNFMIDKEEFYTYDKSPRGNVKVLATVDENSYQPASTIKMGDHPVIWTNEHVRARNIYIFMGHSPDLFNNPAYTKLFSNAIFWAAGK